MTLRVAIVDDEPLAREGLHHFLADENDVAVVGECTNGREAIDTILRVQPDIVFLDVQMPVIDGFGVVEALKLAELPLIVFVTAYDEYAIKAFDVHALDYLLKPVERSRFRAALEHGRRTIARNDTTAEARKITHLLEAWRRHERYTTRFVVRSTGRIYFVDVQDIEWIEAAGNYARLHASDGTRHLIRKTMTAMERELDGNCFVRIHRSAMINVGKIKEIRTWGKGEYLVVLVGGTKVTLGRRYRDRLERLVSDK